MTTPPTLLSTPSPLPPLPSSPSSPSSPSPSPSPSHSPSPLPPLPLSPTSPPPQQTTSHTSTSPHLVDDKHSKHNNSLTSTHPQDSTSTIANSSAAEQHSPDKVDSPKLTTSTTTTSTSITTTTTSSTKPSDKAVSRITPSISREANATSVTSQPRPNKPQSIKNSRPGLSSSGQNLTTVGEDWQNLTSGVKERASAVLNNWAVKTKSSANSLRARTPQPSHSKTVSTSTASTSSKPQGLVSSQSTGGGAQSSSSSLSQDEEPINPEVPTPQVTLERPSLDVRQSSDRGSDRRLLRRNPSPGVPPQSGSMIAPHNKMHQTSSRLLRMTDEERPFTRDFKDLFSTLMVSLPLSAHRVRFQKIDHTFTSEEAINNLGSLKFSQSNRMPDPKDPSRIVTTTTTTTFSMAKEMARSVCQRFMDARFIETADGKSSGVFPLKGALWQMTPKGMHVLQRFCQRNGINQRHVLDVLDSTRNTMQLVILERDPTSDKLSHDRATVEVLFRRFAGQEGPNLKSSTSSADSDSVTDYYNGLVGVKMARDREISGRRYPNTFTGKAAVDWLMDCCTTVDRRETYEIAELFVNNELIRCVHEDKAYSRQNLASSQFQPTKDSIYTLTEKGKKVAGWIKREPSPEARENSRPSNNTGGNYAGGAPNRSGPRDSNNNRLNIIVNDAALRLLFREYLRDTHCEENLSFYLEVREFTKTYDISERAKAFTRLDAIRENLAAAYGLYNAFLAPGSPCELNIDHNLRNSLAGRMTRAVGDDESMLKSLQDVVALFKEAQTSVFKLMSSDSVPKFLKEPRYAHLLREHNFDPSTGPMGSSGQSHPAVNTATLPERTLSRHTRDPRAPMNSKLSPTFVKV